MSDSCCDSGLIHSARRRRVLWAVLWINAVMFVVELTAGFVAESVALQADSLDMLGKPVHLLALSWRAGWCDADQDLSSGEKGNG